MFWSRDEILKLRSQIFTGGQIFVGNGFCDDGLNTAECNFDAGDCCDPSANTDYCTICQCNGTINPGNTGLSSSLYTTGNKYELPTALWLIKSWKLEFRILGSGHFQKL